MNKELARKLTVTLVNYIDENRPEGTMDCSSGECERLEKAFEANNLDFVEGFMEKKLSRLTKFEQCLLDFAKARDEYEYDSTKVVELNNKVIELTKSYAKKLLALAKKELLSYADERNPAIEAMADLERTYFSNPDKLPKWLKDDIARKELNAHTKGYNKGYKDAEKQYNESVAYHFPIMPQSHPFCYEPGGTCSNPQMDCINCPRRNGGGFNTASGTSTATLHGNTSVTDGKEHNQSFTD